MANGTNGNGQTRARHFLSAQVTLILLAIVGALTFLMYAGVVGEDAGTPILGGIATAVTAAGVAAAG